MEAILYIAITLIAGLITAFIFILSQHKEDVWKSIYRKWVDDLWQDQRNMTKLKICRET